ncbi:hypothetical protein K2Z83_10755 [Oscillochloris sp. ZM17-4]|uniref:hypothetical protein n=1 Tax=Oscillochloris sp. ZM17-4 TaxID=2866714 RepID=UPI001C7374E2|nr:hypothetical protein [Oscillochloris sp. ZM17-4]MBX0328158.1 hypothetical protein [Oscillochloris sp. ZM17-4]
MQLLNFSGRLLQALMLGLMGAVFLGVGVFLGVFAARDASAEADRVAAMAPLGLAGLEAGRPGAAALLEGTLSARNPARFRDFIAYTREEYHGEDSDGDADWREDERVTPPLLVDLDGGVAQIGNDSYRISTPHASWQEGSVLYWNGLSGEGTKRYAGLVAGRPVLALGMIQAGPEGNELQAELIFGGTRAEYIANQRGSARILPFMGLIFGGVGVLLLGVGVRTLLRR